MLRGNNPAKVDEKGRLKIPAAFLEELKGYGDQFYVTSETGEYARIFPMKVWEEIESKLARLSSHNQTKQKFDLDQLLWPGGGNRRAGKNPDPAGASGSGPDEGRCRRNGPPDLSGRLEPWQAVGQLEEEPDQRRRPEDSGRTGHLV